MATNKSEVMRKWAIYILGVGLLLHGSMYANFNKKTIHHQQELLLTVAQNGKGQFKQIQAAINSIVSDDYKKVIIKIAAGTYDEKIYLKKSRISFIGEGIDKTIITQSIARDIWRCDHIDDWGVATFNADSCSDISFWGLTIRNDYGFLNTKDQTISCASDSAGVKIIKTTGHQMAFRSFNATKLKFEKCRFVAYGGDTMSPWNTSNGMFYFKECILEGGVDFYCPRGWAYAEKCIFITHTGPAAIWHDGSLNEDSKTVLVNCSFKGYDGFKLGRYHRDAQFYLINCHFPANMSDEDIYLVPTSNTIQWGRRVYYYNCDKENATVGFYKNNLETAKGKPAFHEISASWVFKNLWNPTAENKKS
jgi:pectinesterase